VTLFNSWGAEPNGLKIRGFLREGVLERTLAGLIKIIIGLILSVILITVIYIFWGYYQIYSEFTAKEKYVVRPQVDAQSLSEVGYVRESRTVTCIKNRTKRIYWWIKIPATHKQYLCEWQHGFSGFKKDDAITLIHQVEGEDITTDYTGYLIGLQGKIKDKASAIVTHGVEDMQD
jgi:uncharacterized protein YpmB